jgi:hypothetical protein
MRLPVPLSADATEDVGAKSASPASPPPDDQPAPWPISIRARR